ncbi:MAG TPA: DUF4058 family protein [Chthonomonadaceae bacterium]|nr:DUF4058 family protein [Chthonomonadaceae bacterium]
MAKSPFPGMDPYLEAPGIWESFHHSLIVYTAAALNRVLPAPYVAIVEEWLHILPPRQSIRPDVVIGDAPAPSLGNVALLERTTVTGDAPIIVEALEDEPRRRFVNVVRAHDASVVLATLEYLSHANKAPGRDRYAYLRKQRAICASDTHLIEMDLLRAGSPTLAVPLERLDDTPYDYLCCLHRGGTGARYEIWPATVQQSLPHISVPLEAEVPDVILDVQAVLERAYDEGAYARLLDYSREPVPPLSAENAAWANALLKAQGLR